MHEEVLRCKFGIFVPAKNHLHTLDLLKTKLENGKPQENHPKES